MELAGDRGPRDDLKLAGGNQCGAAPRTAALGRTAVSGDGGATRAGETASARRSDRRGGLGFAIRVTAAMNRQLTAGGGARSGELL